MGRRTHLPAWRESRGDRSALAALARRTIEQRTGTWVFRTRTAPGPSLAIVTDVCIVIGGDDKCAVLRGNGRTRRVSWATFAEHWRPWQGDSMPRAIVLGETLVWKLNVEGL